MRIENETHENYFQIPLDFILLFADLQKPDGWYHILWLAISGVIRPEGYRVLSCRGS